MNRSASIKRRAAVLACCLIAPSLLLPAGCASDQSASKGGASSSRDTQAATNTKPVNASCPMMPEHQVPQSGATTVVYKGKVVGFCCADCVDGWQSLSDSAKDKALREAMAAR